MKRVLVVITTAFVKEGGLTSVMMNYYRALNKDKLQIDFASTNKIQDNLLNEISAEGSVYYKLPHRSSVISYFRSLSKICKTYDVIHIHGNSATTAIELFAAWISNVRKRIVHIHTSKSEHNVMHQLSMPIFKRLNTVPIACSDIAGEWIFGNNNFIILKNAINTSSYLYNKSIRESTRNMLNIDDKFVIGHIGKFMVAKNHSFLLEIFKEILTLKSNSVLLLVGDGVLRPNIEADIDRLNLKNNVIVLGMRNDIPELLQAMDICLLPSLWEGLPLSVLEAQVAGLTCFVSSTITDQVKMSNYLHRLSLSLTPKEWADYIMSNTLDTNRETISQEAYSNIVAEGFEVNAVADRLRKIYFDEN